tara:strand:- start:99 stop:728 length:630 start_codon:yes stop_codon:yes gene_type:complete
MLQIPSHLEKQKEVTITKEEMISFETEIKEKYEDGKIPAPIHLSKDNEDELIEIFQYINEDDWIVSAWRNHYHALLHGFDKQELMDSVVEGRSMATSSDVHKFYSSAIVGGIIPIALGLSMALGKEDSNRRVWCFIGDMTFETGVFHEAYKYSRNFELPLEFVVEDNNLSVHTPTDAAWGVRQEIPNDIVYYKYENGYPHHGTGAWVNF